MKALSKQPTEMLDFVFYGERPCLDFANTLRRRKDPLHPTVDLVASTQNLTNWITAARSKASWAKDLPELRKDAPEVTATSITELRAAILRLAEYRLEPNDYRQSLMSAKETLNEWSTHAPRHYLDTTNEFTKLGTFQLRPTLTPAQILGLVAQDAVTFFGTDNAKRLKVCSHERCGILFEDRSNGMKRQWCSMKACGNRMKAHRHTKKE